jgi:RNA polymerase sigma factor (sigma-70 family)
MPDANDMDLMGEYADCNSETAFAGLVHRHINLVYSVALRFTGNSPDAQDVTQAVFIIFAQKAASLRQRTTLTGWLYETTRFTARQLLRTRARQQAREQEAYMQSTLNDTNSENVWRQLAPLLEEAMARLSEKERTLVALRFFENRSVAETASALGIQEWAARKRVERAIEKLQKFFLKRGIASTAATLAGAISANSVQAAPVALAKSVTAVAIAKGATASASTLPLIKGALKIMAWTKAKTAMVVGVAAILAVGTTTLVVHHHYAGAQTDFPSSSWTNAGYADPPTAVLSTLWAIRQGDGEKIADSFTPELQQQFQQMFAKQMQAEGKSFIEILSQEAPKHFSQNTGIKILGQKTVFGDQIALRVYVPGEQREHTFFLKKIGNEWKVNDIQ